MTAVVAGSETCGLHLEFELCSPAVLQFVLADGGTQLLAVVQHAAHFQRVGTYVSQADSTFAYLAGSNSAHVHRGSGVQDWSVAVILRSQTAEVLIDISAHDDLECVAVVLLAVHYHQERAFNRTVDIGVLGGECHLNLACLVGLDGSQCDNGVQVLLLTLGWQDRYCYLVVGLVGVLDLVGLGGVVVHLAQIHLFLLEAQFAHLNGVVVHGLGGLGNHLTLDCHALGRLSGVGGDRHGLGESSRTSVGVVCYGYLTGLTRLNRLARPLRRGATAAGADVREYERLHALVLEGEDCCYFAISFIDLAEVVVCLLKCDDRLLCHHGYGCQSHHHTCKYFFHFSQILVLRIVCYAFF